MDDDQILLPLSAYHVSGTTGFVPERDPVLRLPAAFDAWEAIVPNLSALIRTRRLRAALSDLPELNSMLLADPGERERALLLLTVFANGWVWGGDVPDIVIPRQVAVPLCALADAMQRPPIVHYASMALNNWCRLDLGQPVSVSNMRMQVQFLGGVDEDWFFIGSLGVELAGAPLIGTVREAVIASHRDDDNALASLLQGISAQMDPVIAALDHMRDWCDPYIFYHRVRPYLNGWPAPGVRYQGVSDEPKIHVGGSAGQSSLIQIVDAAIGVTHNPPKTADYLNRLRTYMPVPHRRLVEDIASHSRIRSRIASGAASLRAAYNEAVGQIDRFRQAHIGLALEYIVKPSGIPDGGKGTGGTDLADFLGSAHKSTSAARI